jgi:dTMP kinase
MAGLGAALVGAGAVVSLGQTFVTEILRGGAAGFGLVLFSLGTGGALGMVAANTWGRKLSPVLVFCGSCTLAGASLFLAASMSSLLPGVFFVGLLGFFGAPGYAGGFTLMHQHVDDEVRGRVFGTLLTVIRVCMVFSLGFSPIVAGLLDGFMRFFFEHAVINFAAFSLNVAGVRLVLWMAGLLIGGSGLWAARRLQLNLRRRPPPRPTAELPAGVLPEDRIEGR